MGVVVYGGSSRRVRERMGERGGGGEGGRERVGEKERERTFSASFVCV